MIARNGDGKVSNYRYSESTSEIKNDYAALLACLRSGTGSVSRQDAASLLWFHALTGSEARESLAAAGTVSACLLVLTLPSVTAVDQTSVIGILHTIAQDEEQRNLVYQGKCPQGRCISEIVFQRLAGYSNESKAQAIGVVKQLSDSPSLQGALCATLQQSDCWEVLLAEMTALDRPPSLHTNLSGLLRNLAAQMEEVQRRAVKAGMVPALLHLLHALNSPHAIQACLGCLEQLLGLTDARQQAAEAHVVPVLLDLVGPPSQRIMELEAAVTYPRTFTFSPPSNASHNSRGASSQGLQCPEATVRQALEAAAMDVPMSQCTSALGWSKFGTHTGVQSAAAACLGCLTHYPAFRIAIHRCGGLHRLAQALLDTMPAPAQPPGSSKAKKSKGLVLTALQEDTLINILAALRFLVLFDVNKVRLQRLGTVPGLVALATQAARPALRSKAQSILGSLAVLDELTAPLQEAGMPGELGMAGPLAQLHPDDAEELRIEDLALTCNSSIVRAKQAQAWQKLQLTQVRRAADSMTRVQTPQAVALDMLTDKLLGKSAGVYDITCTVGRESVPTTAGANGHVIAPEPALQATLALTEFMRTNVSAIAKGSQPADANLQ